MLTIPVAGIKIIENHSPIGVNHFKLIKLRHGCLHRALSKSGDTR